MDDNDIELAAMAVRYQTRAQQSADDRYRWTNPDVYMSALENDRVLLGLLARVGFTNLAQLRVLEIGCGTGGNLLRLLRWGCDPANLVGNELLPERLAQARRRLPAEVALLGGDACALTCGGFDIVLQSTVFSSILDDNFQARLARQLWRMTRPGGGILWYDFCYDNPRNPDVRGVPVGRVRQLFPDARPLIQRVTLAPPLARPLARLSPWLYSVFNVLPFLRTHVLCWLPKPAQPGAHLLEH